MDAVDRLVAEGVLVELPTAPRIIVAMTGFAIRDNGRLIYRCYEGADRDCVEVVRDGRSKWYEYDE